MSGIMITFCVIGIVELFRRWVGLISLSVCMEMYLVFATMYFMTVRILVLYSFNLRDSL